MDRAQFIEQLERLLSDISEAERQEALDYYEGYFDDAGPEHEAEVIRELGSPGKVAAIIKADLKESNDRYAEYSELGYEDIRAREPGQMPDKYTTLAKMDQNGYEEKEDYDSIEHHSETDSSSRNGNRYGEYNDGGNERRFGRDRVKGRFEQAFSRAGEQMDHAFSKAGRQMDEAFSKAGEQFDQTWNQTGEQFDKARSKAGEQFERARNRAGEEYERFRSRTRDEQNREKSRQNRRERGYHADKKKNNAGVILLLIFLVFASPFITGAAGGLLGIVVTILLLPFLLIFAVGGASVGLIVGAVSMFISGIAACFSNPAAGILRMGGGCLLMALGILVGIAAVWLTAWMIPRLLRKFTDFCQKIWRKIRKEGDCT